MDTSPETTVASAGREISESSGCEVSDGVEAFLDKFWGEISIFAFDKAKELADKEKERALKTHVQTSQGSVAVSSNGGGGGGGFTWVILTTAMAQLAITEKAYVNLVFLAPKGFLRKDPNLKATLESIKTDLKKISESSNSSGVSSPAWHRNAKVATALLVVVHLRLNLMEFYEKLSVYGTHKNVDISDLTSEVEILVEKFNTEKNSVGESSLSMLNAIMPTLNWECTVVINLLRSIASMQKWEYLESTIALQEANKALFEWNDLISAHSQSFKKSSFYSSTPSLPGLFLWIKKLKGALVSKFTLYFFDILSKHSTSTSEMKSFCAKLPVDFYSRISGFQKKNDAFNISIVFDSKGTNYTSNGFSYGNLPVPSLQGLESFPAVLSIPGPKPDSHWVNVVMLINDKMIDLNNDKMVGFYDQRAQVTYYVQKIDVKMFLVIIFETKKSEKDSYTQKFLSELATDLKCGKIFAALKAFKA